ncbi:MAG: DUF968 domain-containing protein [Alphaproteobacteria bacterium]|nr:DUF968 domain-containing protein [Alphaproteobacteria bacterium]
MCADSLSPHGFCSGLRQLIEACKSAPDILALHRHNAASLSELRTLSPSLRNTRGEHYADILQRLMERTTAKLKDRGFGADEHRPDDAKPTNHDLSRSTAMSGSPGLASTKQDPPAPASNPPPSSPLSLIGVRPSLETISPADEAKDAVLAASPGAPHQTDGMSPAMMLPAPSLTGDANGLVDRAHACSAATPSPVPGISKGRARPKKADTLLAPSRIAPGVRIDKSLLVIGHERRLRDRAHLKSVAKLPCLICNRQPCHPHHLKFAQRRGLGQKVSDEFVVPLCAVHHGELHRSLSEQAWWKTRNLDPLPVAAALWANRHA